MRYPIARAAVLLALAACLAWAGADAAAATPAALRHLAPEVREASGRTQLPAALIDAVAMTESGGQARAVSPAGAQGVMQLMPPTASWLGVGDAFNPDQNVLGGARYLAALIQHYTTAHAGCPAGGIAAESDTGFGRCANPLVLALAAYNAGPGTVARYGGLPPYPETRRYVAAVLGRFAAYLQTEAR